MKTISMASAALIFGAVLFTSGVVSAQQPAMMSTTCGNGERIDLMIAHSRGVVVAARRHGDGLVPVQSFPMLNFTQPHAESAMRSACGLP